MPSAPPVPEFAPPPPAEQAAPAMGSLFETYNPEGALSGLFAPAYIRGFAPSEDAGYNLAFATEKNYARPVWPSVEGKPQMLMHLDIEVDDVEQAVAYAVGVGAEQAEYQPQTNVRVMLDPAGHPFCLCLS